MFLASLKLVCSWYANLIPFSLSPDLPSFPMQSEIHILLDFICLFSPWSQYIQTVFWSCQESCFFMSRESGTGQSQDRRCAEVEHFLSSPFLVQHYLCRLYSFKFFHLFTAIVATLCQFLPNPFVFLFCIANFGTTVVCHSASSFVPYLTQWLLSQILMCQLKYFLNLFLICICFFLPVAAFQDTDASPHILLLHSWSLQRIPTHVWLTNNFI